MNRQIRELEDSLVNTLNASQVPIECKRVILENLMMKCEIKSFENTLSETVTEKGDLEDVSKLD